MEEFSVGVDWRAAISEEAPAGDDLEYSQEFSELEAAATQTPEQEFGDVLIPAKGPEWQRVFELATALSRRTRDLRVLLLLARAATHLHGGAGLAHVMGAAEELLRERWSTVHPQMTVDGVDDPHVRYGVLCEFAAPDGLVADIRQATGLQSALGVLSVRDLERLVEQGAVEVNGVSMTRAQVDEMVRDMLQLNQNPSQWVDAVLQSLDHMQAIIEQHLGGELVPDWSALRRPLERARGVLQGEAVYHSSASALHVNAEGDASGLQLSVVGAPRLDSISSRADVIKAMDAICSYLDHHEPTNPAPLLIRRAKRLMGMSFVEIVQDMSPDGVNQVMFIAGQGHEGSQ